MDSSVKYVIFAFDLFVCIILWIEFIYSYLHSSNRKKYLRDNSISILGMLPLNLYFLRALRLLKLVQLIRLYVLLRDGEESIAKFLKHTYLDKIILIAIIFIFILTLLILVFDSGVNTMQEALWYIVVSMTGTGYGDIIPLTSTGKIIGMVTMIGGIMIFASITAVISSLYVAKINKGHHDNLQSTVEDLTLEIEKLNKKIDDLKNERER